MTSVFVLAKADIRRNETMGRRRYSRITIAEFGTRLNSMGFTAKEKAEGLKKSSDVNQSE